MIIVCPQCESRYDVAEESLPEAGRAVRCTRCLAEWTAFPGPDESVVDQTWMETERAEATLLDDEAVSPVRPEVVDLATPRNAGRYRERFTETGRAAAAEGPGAAPLRNRPPAHRASDPRRDRSELRLSRDNAA